MYELEEKRKEKVRRKRLPFSSDGAIRKVFEEEELGKALTRGGTNYTQSTLCTDIVHHGEPVTSTDQNGARLSGLENGD